jgi:N-acetylglucosaminyldiphosphoundecaprenol N-acetyl-beta-D-mannosaminyltransferase
MTNNKILDIEIPVDSRKIILEKILKDLKTIHKFIHIVSLNPENLVISCENSEFKKVLQTAQIKIVDGTGIVLAAKLLKIKAGERYPGVDLMSDLIKQAGISRLRVLLIGGKGNLADELAECYSRSYPEAKFVGIEGFENIKKPTKKEEDRVLAIVCRLKPRLVFVAFGSPDQELWIEGHKDIFAGAVCMGVGQGFDVYGGLVKRAPVWIRKIGLEWLYRLFAQPWRWRRQVRLIKFILLITKENRYRSR